MIIAICGFMGAGKSTLLQMYPEAFSIDLDKKIREGLSVELGEYIRDNGWESFREIESETLEASLKEMGNSGLIALGGGTLDQSENIELLKKYKVKILYISVDFETAMLRIQGDRNRPQLDKTKEELLALFEKREALFKKVCHLSLPSDAQQWPTNWTVFKTLF